MITMNATRYQPVKSSIQESVFVKATRKKSNINTCSESVKDLQGPQVTVNNISY